MKILCPLLICIALLIVHFLIILTSLWPLLSTILHSCLLFSLQSSRARKLIDSGVKVESVWYRCCTSWELSFQLIRSNELRLNFGPQGSKPSNWCFLGLIFYGFSNHLSLLTLSLWKFWHVDAGIDMYGCSIGICCLWWYLIELKNRLSQSILAYLCQNWTSQRDIQYSDVDLLWIVIYFFIFVYFIAFFMLTLDLNGNSEFFQQALLSILFAQLHSTTILSSHSALELRQNTL